MYEYLVQWFVVLENWTSNWRSFIFSLHCVLIQHISPIVVKFKQNVLDQVKCHT